MSQKLNLECDVAPLPQAHPCAKQNGICNTRELQWNYTPDAMPAHLQTTTAGPRRRDTLKGVAV